MIGNSNRPRSASSVCAAIFGTNRINLAAVSVTENFLQPAPRKKKTIFTPVEDDSLFGSGAQPQILRHNSPAAFLIKRTEPLSIRRVLRELVAQSDDLMISERYG